MLTKFTALAMGVLLSVSAMAADMATLIRQAQNGDADAQENLGWMYANGDGVRQDGQKAVEWYTKAANQGIAQAQHNMGVMYEYGRGVSQNKSTAKRYYNKACNNGYSLGCDKYHELDQQGY